LAGCGRIGFADRVDAGAAGADVLGADGATCTAGSYSTDWSSLPTWAQYWTEPSSGATASAQVTGGTLRIMPSTIASEWAGVTSIASVDLRGHQFTIEVLQTTTDATIVFGGDGASKAIVRMVYDHGTIYSMIDNVVEPTIPYQPSVRFWRMSIDSATTTLELSSDGTTFTPFYTGPTPADANAVHFGISAGAQGTLTTPGVGIFGRLDDCML
jgi:hypothetical protein